MSSTLWLLLGCLALSGLMLSACGGSTLTECEPQTCEMLQLECGDHSDECDGVINCGSCPTGYECDNAGQCRPEHQECVPETCESLGYECGSHSDECDGVINCGSCPTGYECDNAGQCRPEHQECVPETCESLGYECGSHSDECDGTLVCGPCESGYQCNDQYECDDIPCTPLSCQDQNIECGPSTDMCGTNIDCGDCNDGGECQDGQCVFVPRSPTVLTSEITSITTNGAIGGGHVANDGGLQVSQRGLCWSASQNPSSDNGTCTVDGAGTGDFATTISGLSPATTYFVRAYATNDAGTGWGAELSFHTLDDMVEPGDTMEILIVFMEWNPELGVVALTEPVDVRINDTWYYFQGLNADSPEWDIAIAPYTARGKIITINGPIREIDFNLNQIVSSSLNNLGFGGLAIKMMARHPDTDFSLGLHLDHSNSSDLNYFSLTYDGKGGLWTRHGFNNTYHDNVDFPHFVFNFSGPAGINESWSDSGKFVLNIAGVGRDHPNPYYE